MSPETKKKSRVDDSHYIASKILYKKNHMELNGTFLKVMQIRNAIPWIRLSPFNVQNISVGEIYVNYQGDS